MRFLIVLVLVVLTATPAAATAAPGVITGKSAELHPEGIAWDPLRHTFLLTSLRHGTVEIVRNGTTKTLISDPRMVSTFGVHVVRDRVYVAYGDMGLGRRSTPDTTYKSSGLGVFDLATGRPLHVVDLAIGAGRHSANDVAVDRAGNAYVTDPASDALYRVDRDGRATVLARDPRFGGTIGLNGIVWHPRGFLLAVRYDTGTLFKVTRDGRISEVALDRPLVGGDGMDLRPDGTLAVVTNGLAAPGEAAVSVLRSADDWRTARTAHRTAPWADDEPTTIARSPRGSYVVDGDLGTLVFGAGLSDAYTLREFRESGVRHSAEAAAFGAIE
ncbi:SMP-30/gluconolactonase/LRE family protein [Saccharothrix deserti]|uniref:SMP-30/gluconolactonase/LRE family protein n=1 Tax=Saccharothrix deserti TaxID=2593674 RepID=UPI00131D21CA|nr:SMP-30/gluconolactonase/LRE family protein [Saccharothrix deserti]